MKVTAVLNLKGGVAKTATTVNMAAILAHDYDQRVLVVDADSQCNSTEFFGATPDKGNLAQVLHHDADDGSFALGNIQTGNFPDVDILAGDESLMDLDLTKVETQSVQAYCLKSLATLLEVREEYDRMIIDCPPAFNAASAAALIAADEVVIPIKLDAFSLRGMSNLMRQVKNMQRINPRLALAGLLPTMWYKSANIIAAEKTLRESKLKVFHHIRRTAKVDDMTFEQTPLLVCSANCAAGVDYRKFVAELIGDVQ